MTPDAIFDRVEDIDLALLRAWDIRGLVLDLDNTIVPWHTSDLRPSISAWFAGLVQGGVRGCLLTNNYGKQASVVARALGTPIVLGALKPVPFGYRRSLEHLQIEARHALGVGDQLYTDVLGAKLAGMRAALVQPIGRREFPTTRLMRVFERPVLEHLRRGGMPGA
ncbi:MAG: YqeG family HAD IIIA-type phosphatase [Candidatus Eremiobacter antarcticus]